MEEQKEGEDGEIGKKEEGEGRGRMEGEGDDGEEREEEDGGRMWRGERWKQSMTWKDEPPNPRPPHSKGSRRPC